MFLLVALAALRREVLAAPIISQVQRFVFATVNFDHPIQHGDFNGSLGPADLSASASDSRPAPDGINTLHAQSSQHSTVDAFGFSYEASLEEDGIFHSLVGDATASSLLIVTYVLDVPTAYQFTLTRGGSPNGRAFLDSLPFPGPFPTSGVLQPGSYTFQIGDFQNILISENNPQRFNTATTTATLQFFPISVVGRMTGGGSVFTTAGGRVTHGFSLGCNLNQGPDNLVVNWDGGNNFHLTSLTSATCFDSRANTPNPSAAGFNTYVGSGVGLCNGLPAAANWTFTDAGELGSNDTANIVISGGCSLSVSGNLQQGRHQAHPH